MSEYTKQRGLSIQRSIIVGAGLEGAHICYHVCQRLYEICGIIPPVVRYLILLHPDEERAFRQKNYDSESLDVGRDGLMNVGNLITQKIFDIQSPDLSEIRTELTDSAEKVPSVRAYARKWLFRHSLEIGDKLESLSSLVEEAGHRTTLEKWGIDIVDRHRPSFHLVGSLANPFASGLLVDLAYFIKDINMHHEQNASVSGLLLLPRFAGEDEFQRTWQQTARVPDMELRRWTDSNAYAAIKELNYYMQGKSYQAKTLDHDRVIEFNEEQRPFQNGFCYLVGPTNEQAEAGTSVKSILPIAGEWLTFNLATAVGDAFETATAMANSTLAHSGYASMGLSSWVLPRSELNAYCTDKLLDEAITMLLESQTNADYSVIGERARVKLTPSAVREQLLNPNRWKHKVNDLDYLRNFQRSRSARDSVGTTWLNANQVYGTLVRHDTRHRTQLDRIEDHMVDQVTDVTRTSFEELRTLQADFLRDIPHGGLAIARDFFSKTKTSYYDEISEMEKSYQEQVNRLYGLTDLIDQQRARYTYAVNAFWPSDGNLPIMALVNLGIFTIVPWLLWYIFGGSAENQALAWGVTGISIFFWIALSILLMRNVYSNRNTLTEHFTERQKIDKKLVTEQALLHVWKELGRYANGIEIELDKLHTQLQSMKKSSTDNYQDQQFQHRLYKSPRHDLERSVLTPELTEEFYSQLTFRNRPDRLGEMIDAIEKPESHWFELNRNELYTQIEHHVKEQIDNMGHMSASQLLERQYDQRGLGKALRDGYRQAVPMLAIEPTYLSEDAQQQIRTFCYKDTPSSSTGKLIQEVSQGQPHQFVLTDNPNYFAHLSLRHSIPIQAVRAVKELYRAYQFYQRNGQIAPYHTMAGLARINDDDLVEQRAQKTAPSAHLQVPLEERIDTPEGLVTFGCFLRLIERDPMSNGGFHISYFTEDQAFLKKAGAINILPEKQPLGQTKEDAKMFITNDVTIFDTLRSNIINTLREDVRKLDGSWSQIAVKLYDYQTEHRISADRYNLQSWEHEEIDRFVQQIRTESQKDEGDDPQNTLRIIRKDEESSGHKTTKLSIDEENDNYHSYSQPYYAQQTPREQNYLQPQLGEPIVVDATELVYGNEQQEHGYENNDDDGYHDNNNNNENKEYAPAIVEDTELVIKAE
ncbi:MAG: tubulin-like doman-containing protein [Chloroflexota bacterium]